MAITLTAVMNPSKSVKIERFVGKFAENAMRGVDRACLRIERQIKIELSKGGGFRRAKGRPWVPNTSKHLRVGDGTLRSSWTARPAVRTATNIEGHVSSWVPYSAIHEFGGQTGRGGAVTMPMRPYVRPAIKTTKDAVVQDVSKELMRPLQ